MNIELNRQEMAAVVQALFDGSRAAVEADKRHELLRLGCKLHREFLQATKPEPLVRLEEMTRKPDVKDW